MDVPTADYPRRRRRDIVLKPPYYS
jgi:hypothetical protein